jgi:hypothetical protein
MAKANGNTRRKQGHQGSEGSLSPDHSHSHSETPAAEADLKPLAAFDLGYEVSIVHWLSSPAYSPSREPSYVLLSMCNAMDANVIRLKSVIDSQIFDQLRDKIREYKASLEHRHWLTLKADADHALVMSPSLNWWYGLGTIIAHHMAHPRKSATQQRKNNPRSRLGFLDIPLSFVFVRAFSSCFVLAL